MQSEKSLHTYIDTKPNVEYFLCVVITLLQLQRCFEKCFFYSFCLLVNFCARHVYVSLISGKIKMLLLMCPFKRFIMIFHLNFDLANFGVCFVFFCGCCLGFTCSIWKFEHYVLHVILCWFQYNLLFQLQQNVYN